MTSRRDFLKKSCGLCVAVAGAGFITAALQSCSTVPMVKASAVDHKVNVPLSSFTAEVPYVMVRVASLENDILLVKKSDGTFTGLYMQCTHQNQPLSVSGNGLRCASHGSVFNLEGEATVSPATKPLKKYPAFVAGDVIQIQLN